MRKISVLFVALITAFSSMSFAQKLTEVSYECKSSKCVIKSQFESKDQLPDYFYEIENNGIAIYFAQTKTKIQLGKYKLKGGKHIRLSVSAIDEVPVLKLKLVNSKKVHENINEALKKKVFSLSWKAKSKSKKIWLSRLKPSIEKPKKKKQIASKKSDKKASKNESKTPLDKFAKSLPKSDLDADQLFGFNKVKKELVALKLTKVFKSPKKKVTLFELNPGDVVIQLDKKGKFKKIKSGSKTGFVLSKFLKSSASLTPVQNEKLKKLALEIIKKKKKNKKTIPVEEKVKKSDNHSDKEFKKDTKYYTYSRFGRKDPFIPYEDEIKDGMNIDAVQIVGIIWEENSPIVILEEVNGSGATYTLKENDPIQNGKVFKITPTEVVFELTEFGITRKFAMQLPNLQKEATK